MVVLKYGFFAENLPVAQIAHLFPVFEQNNLSLPYYVDKFNQLVLFDYRIVLQNFDRLTETDYSSDGLKLKVPKNRQFVNKSENFSLLFLKGIENRPVEDVSVQNPQLHGGNGKDRA